MGSAEASKPLRLSDTLCNHVASFDAASMTPATIHAAKRVLLDAVGVMIAASGRSKEARPFIDIASRASGGPCSVLGTRLGAPPHLAALTNGALAHALDFEDTFDRAPGHPHASLVPALIALSQSEGPIEGREFLAALALGGDLACRLGLALKKPLEDGGWYPPPILAAFGAAAGAARLLGLEAIQVRDACSLMLCQATMPGEIKHSRQSTVRAIREAFPAQAAVTCALLARAGVRGFEEPFEGQAGFFALYADGLYDQDALTKDLGQKFWTEAVSFKLWPACRGTHAHIEMALALRAQCVAEPADIIRIIAEHDPVQQMLVEPFASRSRPASAIEAKFSLPFAIATALAKGRVGIADFDEAALADPVVLQLAGRVEPRLCTDSGWQAGSGGSLKIVLANGREYELSLDQAGGCPERPLADQQLLDKFRSCAAFAADPLAASEISRLADSILEIDRYVDVGAQFRPN